MSLFAEIKVELAKLFHHADPEVQAAAKSVETKVDALKTEIEKDRPVFAIDAEAAVAPVAKEAVSNAEHVVTEAVKKAAE